LGNATRLVTDKFHPLVLSEIKKDPPQAPKVVKRFSKAQNACHSHWSAPKW